MLNPPRDTRFDCASFPATCRASVGDPLPVTLPKPCGVCDGCKAWAEHVAKINRGNNDDDL